VAFKIPSLIRTLIADTALSAAFIPVFSELLEKERRREAWQVAATVTLLASLSLSVISLLGMFFADEIVALFGFTDPATVELAVQMTCIMFPTVPILGVAGILMGVLNSYDRFGLPALAPIAWNLVIIGAVVFFSDSYGFHALAWGVTIGTVVELLIQLPAVARLAGRRSLSLNLRHPGVRQVGTLLGPVVLSLGIINFNAFINTLIASYISAPAPAYVDKAFRLFQLPQGMFAVAIGTVLFPTLSRLAAGGRLAEFRQAVSLGVRQILFVTLPFTAFFLVLGLPTVRLVYEHGAVEPAEAEQVAYALAFFSLGMAFVSANTLLNRAFYGIQKPRLPLLVGVVNLLLNLALSLLLYRPLGVGGITLSTSLVSGFNFFALLFLLRREVGSLQGRRMARSGLLSLVALLPLSVASFLVWWGLDRLLGDSLAAQLVAVGLGYCAGLAAYALASWLLHIDEAREVADLVRRRRGGEPPADRFDAGDPLTREGLADA
jgi:putative peptidoglycan lipid II flippase